MIGTEILNCVIESVIGEGGMATVYKARHKTLPDTYRAIKVLHPVMAADAAVRSRFLTEAAILAKLDHPNIVKVYDYLEQGGNLFLLMEYVEGFQLDELIRFKTGPIPAPRTTVIFSKVLEAMSYAHSRGVIHRDLKPANILITATDQPKIIDFGIVKILEEATARGGEHTRAGTRVGTPAFMSPEQILGRNVDARSDIYALGLILFQMITGRAPYDTAGLSEYEIQHRIINEPLPRMADLYPAAPPHLQAVADKATAKNRDDRFPDCAAFRAALQNEAYRSEVNPVQVIRAFGADKTSIRRGERIVLSWDTTAAGELQIHPLGRTGKTSGSREVTPTESTTYTLRAGGEEASVYVEVHARRRTGRVLGLLALLLILALAAVAAFSIRDGEGRNVFQRLGAPKEAGPKPVAEQFLNHLYHRRYAAAKALATEDTRRQIDVFAVGDDVLRDKTSDKVTIEVGEPEIRGNEARVSYVLSNEPAASRSLKLVKQGDRWLAAWSKNDNIAVSEKPVKEEAAPVETAPAETPEPLSAEVQNRIWAVLHDYVRADNGERSSANVDELCDFFAYPVQRYFNDRLVSRPELYQKIYEYSQTKLASHFLDVDWEQSTIEGQTYEGYVVHLYGQYSYSTYDKPDETQEKDVHNRFVLDENFRIISVTSGE